MTLLEDFAAVLRPDLSPGQRAICRLIDGLPPTDEDQAQLYRTLLHRDWGEDLRRRRSRVVLCAGRGSTKTYLAALFSVARVMTADLSSLAPGELAYVYIVAPKKKEAMPALNFVRGFVQTIPPLRREVIGDPMTGESIRFRNGAVIEVVAADKGGVSVRGTPVIALVGDEAAQFRDEHTGVVNDKDIVDAAAFRLLPGGQILLISTLWVRSGLFYDTREKELGTSSSALVIDVPHPSLVNPEWHPPEGVEPGTAAWKREVENIISQDDADALANDADMDACMAGRGEEPMPRRNGVLYRDALDLSGTQHRTGYAIGHSEEGRVIVDGVWSWAPSVPVEERMKAIAKLRRQYHIRTDCAADQFSFAAAAALGRVIGGISMVRDTGNRVAQAEQASKLMQARMLSLPRSQRLARQFPMLAIRNTSGGGQTLAIPTRDLDGGHFDEAVAVMLLCAQLAEDESRLTRPLGWSPPEPPVPWENVPW